MTELNVDIWRAEAGDLDLVTPLFDAYRQFYRLPSDLALSRAYLAERMARDESVVFVAGVRGKEGWGFTQLYPTFSSLRAQRIFVLYDLFVDPNARKKGVGRALMNRARDHAVEAGGAMIVLSTAKTNTIGQALYESLGYVEDRTYLTYELSLP